LAKEKKAKITKNEKNEKTQKNDLIDYEAILREARELHEPTESRSNYPSEPQLKLHTQATKLTSTSGKTLRFGTLNIGGLNRKLGLVMKRIVELDLDWVFTCETQWEERSRNPPNSISNVRGRQEAWGKAHFGTMILHHPGRIPLIEVLRTGTEGATQVFRWEGILFIGVYWKPYMRSDEMRACQDDINFAFDTCNGEPIFLLGDFNARLGTRVGDHSSNSRAKELVDFLHLDLDNGPFTVNIPERGPAEQHYTFRRFLENGRMGTSIVDYVIHCPMGGVCRALALQD
jgi:hypothetical protein